MIAVYRWGFGTLTRIAVPEEEGTVGAPESNAGDDFHFWWAANRALALIEPGTELRLVTLEGLSGVDDPDDAYETVDVAEYLGGKDIASASSLVMSQLKYSTRHADQPWTAARICEQRRRRRADGTTTEPRSVIADLAAAFRQLRDEHGREAVGKARIALVSNQPGDPLLLASVVAAAEWVRTREGRPQRAALLTALPDDQAAVIRRLGEAVGQRLSSEEFCQFLAVLDLSSCGTMERTALARVALVGVGELMPGHGADSARRLFDLVREQALPGAGRRGISADDVLAQLGVAGLLDLYPAPPRLPQVPDPLPAPGARAIADAVLNHLGGLVIAHGEAGVGKTTALCQVGDHLPDGSALVLFDCYGGGEYLSSGEERHTPQRFATQVINELAQRCGTPLLLQPPQLEEDLWRRFSRALERSAKLLDPGAVLVVAVDAADNAMVAATERGDRGFLSGLVRLRLPERVVVVLTARTHRVAGLGADSATSVEIVPFDGPTSEAHLRRHRLDATDADAEAFHLRTGGNPRAQFYALTQADAHGSDIPTLLERCERTPEALFDDLIESALQVSGADAGGQRWLALLLALARPVRTEILAEALDVDLTNVTAFAAGLVPGVKVADGAVQFRDEDFETYVRDRVDPADVIVAHDRLADMFLASRTDDSDAAAHVADHLFDAGRLTDLLRLVLSEGAPVGIGDGFRREHVQGRRLDLAARAAAGVGDAAAAVRIAVRGCDTASRFGTLSELVETRMDLVARYVDAEFLRAHALQQSRGGWLGPVHLRIAAALSRDPEQRAAARSSLDSAEAWLRRWMANREGEGRQWDVGADDVAAGAEARYRLDGIDAAIKDLRRWRPMSLALAASAALATRLAGELSPDETREALRAHGVPLAAQAPVLAQLASPSVVPDRAWVTEVVEALLTIPAGEPQAWHVGMLDAAIRYGDRKGVAMLARHWSHELPAGRWQFNSALADGIRILQCHAVAAALSGEILGTDALIPASLRPKEPDKGHSSDSRAHELREWIETVSPVVEATVLAARAAASDATASEVIEFCDAGLALRAERRLYRWFRYDTSYRAWATLVAGAVADSGAPVSLLDQLADAAPSLLRDGAPALWLDLADTLIRHGGHEERAAVLCMRAASHARDDVYPAADRLDLIARSADIAAVVVPQLGQQLFDQAVDVATGINDDAARMLSVHADLARRATIPPSDRAAVAARLVRAAEAVTPHVTAPDVVPHEEIVRAAARLDPTTGLAAASRWDDEDRARLAVTLSAALVGAVDSGAIPRSQALALDHFVEDDERRLYYQLDIVARMSSSGAAGTPEARIALNRAASWLRRSVPARRQAELARTLIDAAAGHGLDAAIRPTLAPVLAWEDVAEIADENDGPVSRRWSGDNTPSEVKEMLANPASRGWTTVAQDAETLTAAYVHGEELRSFISGVVLAVPMSERVDALGAVAGLAGDHAATVLEVLAGSLTAWRGWPGIAAWAETALPGLLLRCLTELTWQRPADVLLAQLRCFADDDEIRRAILHALPDARPRLTPYGWQNIAALLGQLCEPGAAADAVLGLLADRLPADQGVAPAEPDGPLPALLWSAFGHPRREVRWRAAHAVRELLTQSDSAVVEPLAAALVRTLDRGDPGPFRDSKLHFYRLSAIAGLLVALQRVAADRPAVLVPHLSVLVRYATSRDLPHVQIRELARRAALVVAGPTDPIVEELQFANQPARCHVDRKRHYGQSDWRATGDHAYDFDSVDTIPYWYAPLARVFDVPVDTIAEAAERWILDRWGHGREDWWTDVRELRNERSAERMSHRHGTIPQEESLRLYIEYHAMMTAAGDLVDAGVPVRVDSRDPWDTEDSDGWEGWLSRHLPPRGPWRADLGSPVPAESVLFGRPLPVDADWDTPAAAAYDHAVGLVNGVLPASVLVAAATNLNRTMAREKTCVRSALVAPDHAEDLQRALAAAGDSMDWKLPEEDEHQFEVDHGPFVLRGWLVDPHTPLEGLDEHDPYARDLSPVLPMPGRGFREAARVALDPTGTVLATQDGATVVHTVQWADGERHRDVLPSLTSSGYRVYVDRAALLRHLSHTGTSLILEVQIGRHRSGAGAGDYRPPRSRLYIVDAAGRLAVR
ncbi:hypothetical protein ACFU8I_01370 [Streptomyces sp. NPDC057540]|uniref:hypothetical protein n=1 Tax=Streptomyces sp. NPDC057540 TaxID=3346160 RepID=UPI0036D08F72